VGRVGLELAAVSVPQGFYEKVVCEDIDWAFVRGTVMSQAAVDEYDASRSGLEQAFFAIPNNYPKWTLYGGPLPTMQDGRDLEFQMRQWARGNGYVWFDDDMACVLPSHVFRWPYEGFRWQWVWEQNPPAKVKQEWDGRWVWA
jgi:hypothetical protein